MTRERVQQLGARQSGSIRLRVKHFCKFGLRLEQTHTRLVSPLLTVALIAVAAATDGNAAV